MVQHPQGLGASLRRGLLGYRLPDQPGQDLADAAALRGESPIAIAVPAIGSSSSRLFVLSRYVLDRRGEQRDGAVSVHAATKTSAAHAPVATAELISPAAET